MDDKKKLWAREYREYPGHICILIQIDENVTQHGIPYVYFSRYNFITIMNKSKGKDGVQHTYRKRKVILWEASLKNKPKPLKKYILRLCNC